MQIEIDGVERQLLLRLLAVYIKEQDVSGSAVIRNCDGSPAAHDLFKKLLPHGLSVDSEFAYFVESTVEESLQPERVAIYASNDDVVMYNNERCRIFMRLKNGGSHSPDNTAIISPCASGNRIDDEDIPCRPDIPMSQVSVKELSWPFSDT